MSKNKSDNSQKSNNYIGAFFSSIIGVVAGVYAIKYIYSQGFNSVAPIGFFCGLFSLIFIRSRSNLFGLWCLILALTTSLYAELYFFHPKITINAFLENLSGLPLKTLGSIAFGTLIAFYFGRGRDKKSKESSQD